MKTRAEKTNPSTAIANQVLQQKENKSNAEITDSKAEFKSNEKAQSLVDVSPQKNRADFFYQLLNSSNINTSPLQRKLSTGNAALRQKQESSTGSGRQGTLPNSIKTGVETLSGLSLDDVKVNYDSPKPAQIGASAYTQGSSIHVSPGQEKHIPHEAWHVVQQKQGRVQPSTVKDGVSINDSPSLEQEADIMGVRAASSIGADVVRQKKSVQSDTAQLKIANYKEYDKGTTLGFFHRKSKEIDAIDDLMKEYISVRDRSHIGANKDTLLILINSIKRYTDNYIQSSDANKDRVVKIKTYLVPKLDEEAAEVKTAFDTAFTSMPVDKFAALSAAQPKSERAEFEKKLNMHLSLEAASKPRGELKKVQGKGTEGEDVEVEVEGGGYEWESALEDLFTPIESTIGGDNRSGLADLDKYDYDKNDNANHAAWNTNSYDKETQANEDNPATIDTVKETRPLNILADSLGLAKSLYSLGWAIGKDFDDRSPEAITERLVDLTAASGAGVENAASLVSNVALAKGAKDLSDQTGAVASVAGGVNSIFSVISVGIKKITGYFKDKKLSDEDKEKKADEDAVKNLDRFAKLRDGLEYATVAANSVKNIFTAAKDIMEVSGNANEVVKNFIPGMDIALSGIAIIGQCVDLFESITARKKMALVQEEAKINLLKKMKEHDANTSGNTEDTDANYEQKLKDHLDDKKDLRAKKSNLQALYDEDSRKLQLANTGKLEKEKILSRREGTKQAMDIIDEELQKKTLQQNGIKDKDSDLQSYQLATDFKDLSTDRIIETGVKLAAELVKLAGSIITLVGGPAAPVGAILKGVGAGVQFGIVAGKAITAYGRDKAASKSANTMIENVQKGEGHKVIEKRKDTFFSFNENKSSNAKLGEKKHQFSTLINLMINIPAEKSRMLRTLQLPPHRTGPAMAKFLKDREAIQTAFITKDKNAKMLIEATGISAAKLFAVPNNKQSKYLAMVLMGKK